MWMVPNDLELPSAVFAAAADTLDADVLLLLASCFTMLADRLRREAEQRPDLGAQAADDYASRLLDLQRQLRAVAESRGVVLPWLPMNDVAQPPSVRWVRLIGGIIEGLRCLSRASEPPSAR